MLCIFVVLRIGMLAAHVLSCMLAMLCIFVVLRIGMLAAHVLSYKAILQVAGMCMFAPSFLHIACCAFP